MSEVTEEEIEEFRRICNDFCKGNDFELNPDKKHADTAMQFTSHGSVNHPVGMNYRSYAYKDPASYVSPEIMDKRIILEDGEVTCISCHASKSGSSFIQGSLMKAAVTSTDGLESVCTSSKELTTGTDITQLCLSCHDM